MKSAGPEKLEIIRLVEQSHLPVKRTLEKLGIARATFYRWCDLYQNGGPEALDDRAPAYIIVKAADEFSDRPRQMARWPGQGSRSRARPITP